MVIGKDVPAAIYTYDCTPIPVADTVKGLCMLVQSTSGISMGCEKVGIDSMRKLWMLQYSLYILTVKNYQVVLNSMINTEMEFCGQSWRSCLKRDRCLLEHVQRRGTKLGWRMQQPSDKRRLETLNMYSVGDRRDRRETASCLSHTEGSH